MVFSNVLDLSSNASAISKHHGMRDLVSPADALSLGAETLFVFCRPSWAFPYSQSIKPVVHWTSPVERLHGSKNRTQPLVFAGNLSRKTIKFPRKSWATPRSQACSQSITKQSIPGSLVHKIMQIFVFLLLCNQQNNPWWFFSAFLLQTKWCNPCCYLWWHSTYSKCCLWQTFHWGWMGFCTFPHLLYNFCEKCSAFQAFALVVPSPGRQGLPGCMERVQLLLAVSSQKPKRNWLMIGLSRENKKTGNDRQLFSPCAHQLCSLTSKCKNRYILLCTLYPIYLYM